MREELNQGLIDFLKASPTPFHATASLVQRLEAAGYQRLDERRFEAEENDEPFDWNREKQLLALPDDSAQH